MLSHGRQSSTTQFHAEDQPREYALHVALHLGIAAVPARAIGKWSGVTFAANHDHRILIGLRFGDISAHNLVESLREKLILKVLGIEDDAGDRLATRLFVFL